MLVKLIQDSVIFVSGLTKEELAEANKFCPGNPRDTSVEEIAALYQIGRAHV